MLDRSDKPIRQGYFRRIIDVASEPKYLALIVALGGAVGFIWKEVLRPHASPIPAAAQPVAIQTDQAKTEAPPPASPRIQAVVLQTERAKPNTQASSRSLELLKKIQSLSSEKGTVELQVDSTRLKIRTDFLTLSAIVSKTGYLYILQAGSDGSTVNLLFPNELDSDNLVRHGITIIPRSSWRIRAAGPVGNTHLLAYLSDRPLKLDQIFSGAPFAAMQVNETTSKTLLIEATESTGGMRFGTSSIVVVSEMN